MCRILVIGAGMAGLSIATRLAKHHEVTVAEAEFQPGYHSTGRSAAVLHIPFVNNVVHELTLESLDFYRNPPKGFGRLTEPLPFVLFAEEANLWRIDGFLDQWSGECDWLRRMSKQELHDLVPVLKPKISHAVLDLESRSIDVSEMIQGFRKCLNERNATLRANYRIQDIKRVGYGWTVRDSESWQHYDLLVNAAGAWADEVAEMAGIEPVGLIPKRRTCIVVKPQKDPSAWPMCYSSEEDLYFRPQGSRLLVSPADETETVPSDTQPELLDIAIAMDRLHRYTTISVDRPDESWAGLRSSVRDNCPVIGFDPMHEGFFWCVAFGGFGIQTAPGCSQLASDIISHVALSERQEALRRRCCPERQGLRS